MGRGTIDEIRPHNMRRDIVGMFQIYSDL